jgi:hypothetical protein
LIARFRGFCRAWLGAAIFVLYVGVDALIDPFYVNRNGAFSSQCLGNRNPHRGPMWASAPTPWIADCPSIARAAVI